MASSYMRLIIIYIYIYIHEPARHISVSVTVSPLSHEQVPSDFQKPLLHVVHIYVPAPAQTEQYLSSQDAHPSPLSYCPLEHTSMQKLWLTISPR